MRDTREIKPPVCLQLSEEDVIRLGELIKQISDSGEGYFVGAYTYIQTSQSGWCSCVYFDSKYCIEAWFQEGCDIWWDDSHSLNIAVYDYSVRHFVYAARTESAGDFGIGAQITQVVKTMESDKGAGIQSIMHRWDEEYKKQIASGAMSKNAKSAALQELVGLIDGWLSEQKE